MGKRIVKASGEMIRQALLLPEDCVVKQIAYDLEYDRFSLLVESSEFSGVDDGCAIPCANPTYRQTDGKPEFIGWDVRQPGPPMPMLYGSSEPTDPVIVDSK